MSTLPERLADARHDLRLAAWAATLVADVMLGPSAPSPDGHARPAPSSRPPAAGDVPLRRAYTASTQAIARLHRELATLDPPLAPWQPDGVLGYRHPRDVTASTLAAACGHGSALLAWAATLDADELTATQRRALHAACDHARAARKPWRALRVDHPKTRRQSDACREPYCRKPVHARRLCREHYDAHRHTQRARRANHVNR